MKSAYLKMIFISLLTIVAFSCKKSSNTNNSTCTATTGDTGPLSSNQSVPYTASVTGGATITSLTYQDSAGMTTIKNPPLPFSKSVNLKSGTTVSISASGSSNSGEITVTSNGNYPNNASCP
jgi:hypothetical protein